MGKSKVSMHLNHLGEDKELSEDSNRIRQTLFPYYSLKEMKSKCEQFIGDKEGLIITKIMAQFLGIEELDHNYSLKMKVYIPTTMEMVDGSKQTLTGGIVKVEAAEINYTVKEVDVPIIGILNYEHVMIKNGFGYLNNDYMTQLSNEVQSQATLSEGENIWKSNTYTVFMNKKNFDYVNDMVYELDSNYTMFAIQDTSAKLMSKWTSMERNVQYYTLILFLCSIVLILIYGLFLYKKEKKNLSILKMHLLNKCQMYNIIKKEVGDLLVITIVLSVILTNALMLVGFSTGLFIKGVYLWQQVFYNNVIAIIYSILLVLLSHAFMFHHIRKEDYD